MQTKKNKTVIDIITVALLFVAFIFAFVMGFMNISGTQGQYFLTLPILSLIAVGGLGVLYFSGTVVELVSRIKKDRVNVGFMVLFSLATVAYVALIATMLGLLCELTAVTAFLPRFVYLAASIIIIASYYESVVYSSKLEAENEEPEEAEEETKEEAEEENETEE